MATPWLPAKTHKRCSVNTNCEFEDIRGDASYTTVNNSPRLELIFDVYFPFLNGYYSSNVFIFAQTPMLIPSRSLSLVPLTLKDYTIPQPEVFDFIAAVLYNYTVPSDFSETGYVRTDDGGAVFQWTDLETSSGGRISVQIGLEANGNFHIRSGRCSGDLGDLNFAPTGYQATSGSGQFFYDVLPIDDPCSIALDFVLSYQQRYVDQDVSQFLVLGDYGPFDQNFHSSMPVNVTPIVAGTLAPLPQGELLIEYDGVIYQGQVVAAY